MIEAAWFGEAVGSAITIASAIIIYLIKEAYVNWRNKKKGRKAMIQFVEHNYHNIMFEVDNLEDAFVELEPMEIDLDVFNEEYRTAYFLFFMGVPERNKFLYDSMQKLESMILLMDNETLLRKYLQCTNLIYDLVKADIRNYEDLERTGRDSITKEMLIWKYQNYTGLFNLAKDGVGACYEELKK